ncbi:MAG: LEA type 2 family protein [Planctomycetota bacterium]
MKRALSLPFLAVLACMSGCEVLQELAANLDRPTASFQSLTLNDLGLEQLTLGLEIKVDNPYGVALPIDQLGYRLASGATPFLSGETSPGVSIPANGSKSLTLPLTIKYTELLNLVAGIRPGSVVPYTANLDVGVNAPGLGPLKLPLKKEGELPVPTAPKVELTSVNWDSLSLQQAAATVNLKIGNENEFPFDLKKFSYDLKLGGKQIANTALQSGTSFGAGEAGSLSIPISFSPASLGLAAFNMLMGDGAGYSIAGDLELDTPFGALTYPYSNSGQTIFQR